VKKYGSYITILFVDHLRINWN